MSSQATTDVNPQLQIVPIFSGGGTRLPAHIGILDALHSLNIGFEHIVGVSGGSIVAALYCSGMPLNDIKTLAMNTDFRQFRGFSLVSLIRDGGLCSGDHFERWMDTQLNGLTFAELTHDLHIVATDVSSGGPVIFNRHTSPDLKVATAVRFSMSIPLVFSFKTYKNHILVDGAILSEDALFQDWSGNGTPVICFRLKSEPAAAKQIQKSWFPLSQYIMMLIRTFMTTLSREYVHAEYWHSTVIIDTGKTSAVDFNMTETQKTDLYQAGYVTALSYLPMKLNLR